MCERALLDHGTHWLPLPERADAANLVAGEALGLRRLHHLRRLASNSSGELLHRDFLIGRDDHADRLAVDQRHQRLQDARWVLAERRCGLEADALGVGIVVVSADGEGNTGSRERACCWGGFGHGRCLAPQLRGAKRRSNPESCRGGSLDCFALLAMTAQFYSAAS